MATKKINNIKLSRNIGLLFFTFFIFQYYLIPGRKLISEDILPYFLFISLGFLLLNFYFRLRKEKKDKTFTINKYIPFILGLIATVIVTVITLMFI